MVVGECFFDVMGIKRVGVWERGEEGEEEDIDLRGRTELLLGWRV